MKFGLFGGALASAGQSSDSQGYEQFVDYILEADKLGFHSAFIVEHHFTGINQISATINLLSYLAGRTTKLRLGTGVTVLPWHNPVMLAEQIATADVLSGGRIDIGVGKGYRPCEFKGFGISPDEAQARFDEGLDLLMRSLTSAERFSHDGQFFRFNDIVVEPAPVQKPHPPIWVGAGSEKSIRNAAKNGFNLLLDHWADADRIEERMGWFREEREASGFAGQGQVGVTRALLVSNNSGEHDNFIRTRARLLRETGAIDSFVGGRDAAIGGQASSASTEERAWQMAEAGAVVGPADVIVEKLRRLENVGVDYVLLVDTAASVEGLREFAEQVMPAFTVPAPIAAE